MSLILCIRILVWYGLVYNDCFFLSFSFQRVGVCLIVLHSLGELFSHLAKLDSILRSDKEDSVSKGLSNTTSTFLSLPLTIVFITSTCLIQAVLPLASGSRDFLLPSLMKVWLFQFSVPPTLACSWWCAWPLWWWPCWPSGTGWRRRTALSPPSGSQPSSPWAPSRWDSTSLHP